MALLVTHYTENYERMNNYGLKQTFYISMLIILSISIGLCFAVKLYWPLLFLLISLSVVIYRLIELRNNTIKNLHRFVSSIRFEDFNISFKSSASKGLEAEIGQKLDAAIAVLNEKAQQKNTRLSFNELLLNRIDFSIIVADKNDSVTWINKSAVNMVGRIKTLLDLKKKAPEFYETIGQMTSGETRIVKFSDGHENEGVAVSVVNATIRKDEIRIISLKNIQSVIDETESEAW